MKVQELLDKEEKWTKYVPARDKIGNGVYVTSDEAVSFDLVGAVCRCYIDDKEQIEIFNKITEYIKEKHNDKYTAPEELEKIGYFDANVFTSTGTFNDCADYKEITDLCKELDI